MEMISFARAHAEDDPYGLVRFEGEARPTLFKLDGGKKAKPGCSSFCGAAISRRIWNESGRLLARGVNGAAGGRDAAAAGE
jgi:hypothetical protein